jgi:tRNA (guanine37-N1)-methyltransferase
VRISVVTIFPDMFPGPLGHSLLARAQESALLKLEVVDLRDYTSDRHRTVDDAPFGGGAGMVMKPEPFFEAVDALRVPGTRVVLPSPQGRRLDQAMVLELSSAAHLLVLCGHYEGIDQRVSDALVDVEFSLGDYVLTGGELAAMVLIDAMARHVPGVVGDFRSVERDSFYDGVLDHPHYTRPRSYRGLDVPEVLLSGDHARIERWRREQSLRRTAERRPDLLDRARLTEAERRLLGPLRPMERADRAQGTGQAGDARTAE